jgi:hypothetical protein
MVTWKVQDICGHLNQENDTRLEMAGERVQEAREELALFCAHIAKWSVLCGNGNEN